MVVNVDVLYNKHIYVNIVHHECHCFCTVCGYMNRFRVASFFSGLRIRLGTILGRFSIIYFRGLGLRIRVGVRVSVVLWSG